MDNDILSSVMADISNINDSLDMKLDLSQSSKDFITQQQGNPWSFSTLEDYLFYCCPECPHKSRSSISFTHHAVKHHPKAKDKFGDQAFLQDLDEQDFEDHLEHSPDDQEGNDDEDFEDDIKPKLDQELFEDSKEDIKQEESEDTLDRFKSEELCCDLCQEKFNSDKALASHLLSVHHEEKNFRCQQCDYKAKSQLLITKHVRRLHKKERKHACHLCDKSFFEKWNLTDHIVAVHQKVSFDRCL